MIFLHVLKYGRMTGTLLVPEMPAYFVMYYIRIVVLLIWLVSYFQLPSFSLLLIVANSRIHCIFFLACQLVASDENSGVPKT